TIRSRILLSNADVVGLINRYGCAGVIGIVYQHNTILGTGDDTRAEPAGPTERWRHCRQPRPLSSIEVDATIRACSLVGGSRGIGAIPVGQSQRDLIVAAR